jgi:hypothetical protein
VPRLVGEKLRLRLSLRGVRLDAEGGGRRGVELIRRDDCSDERVGEGEMLPAFFVGLGGLEQSEAVGSQNGDELEGQEKGQTRSSAKLYWYQVYMARDEGKRRSPTAFPRRTPRGKTVASP